MRTLSSVTAVAALFLTVASLLVGVGVLFALILFFPLSLLALVGVISEVEHRAVRPREPSMNPTEWRDS